jgi:hypothetical protein
VAVANSTPGSTSVLVGSEKAVAIPGLVAGGTKTTVAAAPLVAVASMGRVGDTNKVVMATVAVDGKWIGVLVRSGTGVQVGPAGSKLGVGDDRSTPAAGGRGSVATKARAATLTTIVKTPPITVQMRCSALNRMRWAAWSKIETSIRPAPKRNSKAAKTPTMTRLAVSTIPDSFSLVGANGSHGYLEMTRTVNQAAPARSGQRTGGEERNGRTLLNYNTIVERLLTDYDATAPQGSCGARQRVFWLEGGPHPGRDWMGRTGGANSVAS